MLPLASPCSSLNPDRRQVSLRLMLWPQAEKIHNAITFDMGGTTAKASIIENGAISTASEYEVGSSFVAH